MKHLTNTLILLFLLELTASCAAPKWPATAHFDSSVTGDQQAQIIQAYDMLNLQANKVLVNVNSGSSSNFLITISVNSSAQFEADYDGLATWSSDNCQIQINPEVFSYSVAFYDPNNYNPVSDYLTPVVWHETGHCSGLEHVTDVFAIMYPYASAFSYYSNAEKNTFINDLEASAHF